MLGRPDSKDVGSTDCVTGPVRGLTVPPVQRNRSWCRCCWLRHFLPTCVVEVLSIASCVLTHIPGRGWPVALSTGLPYISAVSKLVILTVCSFVQDSVRGCHMRTATGRSILHECPELVSFPQHRNIAPIPRLIDDPFIHCYQPAMEATLLVTSVHFPRLFLVRQVAFGLFASGPRPTRNACT